MSLATDQKIDEDDLGSLSQSLLAAREEVFELWERQVRAQVVGANKLHHPILFNTLPSFYDNLAEAMTSGYPRQSATSGSTVASSHGEERAQLGSYGPAEIVHEYQILEESIIEVCARKNIALSLAEYATVRRSFNLAVLDAVGEFAHAQTAMRDRVAAALAHDMRNPLSGMTLRAQLLSSPNMPENVRRLASKIRENGDRLNAMFDELMDALAFGGNERLPLELSSFDMLAVARDACAELSDTSQARCETKGDSIVGYWCANLLRRAIDNLLSNAMKYGDGGLISVNVARWDSRIWISVHNFGESVPAAHLNRMFDHLRRESSGGPSGWGLGLPFVKKVAESHGGSVTVDSDPQRGTTVTIDLPLDARDAPPLTQTIRR
ncbi:sensor histidine kinase KdpD [Massilia sp. 9096]|uniref:sensor histidine kinase n=1 Tax=Massilia sp. 9096 TaxID=1500894 RepID=UPI0018CDD951|nr:HAMP domain-containing sensor histidine kinase [Massilia sp. 9096]